MNPAFHRLKLVTGEGALEQLNRTRVIVFGVGGVGSWCAEALARSGIGHLTIVDSDVVCVTNINRQVQATTSTVGKAKTDELLARLKDINPQADITALQKIYSKQTAGEFDLAAYDYVIDCIDSLSNKVELIVHASQSGAKVYCALGASAKLDPLRIKVAPLEESYNCPLGRFVRKRLHRRKFTGEVTCVFSDENLETDATNEAGCGTGDCLCPKTIRGEDGEFLAAHEWCSSKKRINGSAVHITGIFGFMLAGLVVQDVVSQVKKASEANKPAEDIPHDTSGSRSVMHLRPATEKEVS